MTEKKSSSDRGRDNKDEGDLQVERIDVDADQLKELRRTLDFIEPSVAQRDIIPVLQFICMRWNKERKVGSIRSYNDTLLHQAPNVLKHHALIKGRTLIDCVKLLLKRRSTKYKADVGLEKRSDRLFVLVANKNEAAVPAGDPADFLFKGMPKVDGTAVVIRVRSSWLADDLDAALKARGDEASMLSLMGTTWRLDPSANRMFLYASDARTAIRVSVRGVTFLEGRKAQTVVVPSSFGLRLRDLLRQSKSLFGADECTITIMPNNIRAEFAVADQVQHGKDKDGKPKYKQGPVEYESGWMLFSKLIAVDQPYEFGKLFSETLDEGEKYPWLDKSEEFKHTVEMCLVVLWAEVPGGWKHVYTHGTRLRMDDQGVMDLIAKSSYGTIKERLQFERAKGSSGKIKPVELNVDLSMIKDHLEWATEIKFTKDRIFLRRPASDKEGARTLLATTLQQT